MPSIEKWLTDLGLEKYLGVFEDAEIDTDVLLDLTEEDLKELAIPLGPRRKIWKSLEAKREVAQESHPLQTTSMVNTPHAERRHLTIMFVDLVGSTHLGLRLDAEDLRDVIGQYQNTVAKVVKGYDGFVATLMGDGVLCYFGWPHAHEDDTERAVRAGLDVLAATQEIGTPDGTSLSARVGVATGVVVVGDLISMGTRQEAVVVGETPNLAARLQSVARPNELVIPGEARALLSNAFELKSLGYQELKGVDQPVEAFVVERERVVESRFAARQSGKLTPLIGRDAELKQISQLWSLAKSGTGSMVLLEGEAGIGKSRLVRAAIDLLAGDPHIRLTYQCSPYHRESAFYPFTQQMSLAAGLTPKDTVEVRQSKLASIFHGAAKSKRLLESLMGIGHPEAEEEQNLSPGEQRSELMHAIAGQIIERASEKPVLMVFEDLYWIDPTSQELLEMMVRLIEDHRVLILATTRSPFDHSFRPGKNFHHIPLERLNRQNIYAIVDRITGGKSLPKSILQIIAQRTDGVPLFVEELTRSILDSDALSSTDRSYVLDGALGDIAIPNTLHDSLTERLDRLGPAKEVAQITACVGREFDHRLISQICDIPEAKIDAALQQLVTTDLIQRRGTPPKARYTFRHALVRDAAYDSLLKDRRRFVHQRILTALENVPGTAPELLALHAEAAGLSDRAIALWFNASRAAIERPAYQEAEAHVRKALVLNAPLAKRGDPAAIKQDLDLHVQLSLALIPAKGVWSDEVIATLEQALVRAEELGETAIKGDVLYNLLLGTYFQGSLAVSVRRADELKRIALASGDIAQLMVAKRLAAIGRLNLGRFEEAQPHLNEAEDLCEEVADQDLAARFGHDPVVTVKVYQALNLTFRGKTRDAAEYVEAAMQRAEEIGHINTTCIMLALAVVVAQVSGDLAAETTYLKRLSTLTQEHNVAASRMGADAMQGLLQLAQGEHAGLETYRVAEATILSANIRLLVPGHRVLAASRLFELGHVEWAEEMANKAEALMAETGENSWLPELLRLRAKLAVLKQQVSQAEALLKQAIDVASQTGANIWRLRCATDLARLLLEQKRYQPASEHLASAIEQVDPGNCEGDLSEAQALAGQLDLGLSSQSAS